MTNPSTVFDAFSVPDGREFDVVCVGTALMDHLVFADFDKVHQLGLTPGTMALADAATVAAIRELVGDGTWSPGGAEANTAVGVSSFGGAAAFIGAVGTDEIGDRYASELAAMGVRVVIERVAPNDGNGEGTGTSYVIVTPDAERTMSTTLGVAPMLDHAALDVELLSSTRFVYISAYALDFPDADRLIHSIVEIARSTQTRIALSVADPFSAVRHRDALKDLLDGKIDLLFANEQEALSLTSAQHIDDAIAELRRPGVVSIVTRGAQGAIVATDKELFDIAAAPTAQVVDATGAGDLFAAGVIFGFCRGMSAQQAGNLGALAASEVIGHLGAHPQTSLVQLLEGVR